MEIFEFQDFRAYLRAELGKMPKGGHGQSKLFAEAAGVSTAFFSQVLAGKRQFSIEQATLIADHVGLNEMQTEYLLTLVELERAGNERLREHLRKRQARIRKSVQQVSKRFKTVNEVSEKDQPLYYSDWIYIAIHQLTALKEFNSAFKIAERLGLPLKRVKDVISFLVGAGLCVEKNGKLAVGAARMHLTADSPWIKQHHANWRGRALESVASDDSLRLHYSSPMTLSKADAEKVRALLLAAIESVGKVCDPSPSEELVCLNIDWFRIGRGS